MSYHDDLAFALQLANAADAITLARFAASDLKVSSKPDMTPVSDADIATERELRDLIAQRFPEDAILGEEFGGTAEFTGRQWIIDPIDGTKNYVRGVPVWATLIALLVDGHPVVGVVSAPAIAHRWWAAQREGAWRSNPAQESRRIHVSNVAQLTDASVSFSSLDGWKERGLLNNFVALSDETWRLRGFGDFFSYCLVAEGAVDIAAEPEVSLWDLAPLSILVEEAGGVFSSFDGALGPHGGNALATNGLLHDEVRTMLTSSR
ncbi:histidinol-phosphatase [Corynebacterium diphtheriae]|uniref:histidinol-phosphatase n=1 Tax=Corynebacterium diphtheriae TaxID=1717 RepID=UPI00086B9BC9|nr:histidinol-phosphatase [Corynebacterium diphtheriae]ODS20076.1 histidinol-phosphatase [Corynebacterium diphtheriae]OLN12226.1 histidinol-phosphatase [Corynebacterium diphtheriae]QBY10902.1 histidinol-phosphatase [Corynebacterium diphtheriae]RKW92331.1 histidinol-phosphatase [Corynebacterium diphtheriae]RLP09844.1 histidinol-phosphatase [Corynebacterium diphtheriae]